MFTSSAPLLEQLFEGWLQRNGRIDLCDGLQRLRAACDRAERDFGELDLSLWGTNIRSRLESLELLRGRLGQSVPPPHQRRFQLHRTGPTERVGVRSLTDTRW